MKLRFNALPVIFWCSTTAAVFVDCGGGGLGKLLPRPSIEVIVSPKTVNLKPGEQQSFVASVSGTENKGVTWSLGGPGSGTVDSAGNYTAPMADGTYYVIAASAADATKSDAATVTVDPPGSLNYKDPVASGYDFRFIKNADLSTPTHLVLDLVTSARRENSVGLAFTLSLGATSTVSWAKVRPTDSMMVQNGTVFNLGASPIGLKTTVENAQLKAVVAQKGISNAHALNEGTLARVALDANHGTQPGAIALSAVKFQILTSTGTIIVVVPESVGFGELAVT